MKRVRNGAALLVMAVAFGLARGAFASSAPRSAVSKVRKTAMASAPDTAVTMLSILGIWHGRSDCLEKGTACKDEIVEYHFQPYAGHPDSVWLDAKKLVAGRYQSMGAMGFGFDAATRTWTSEYVNPHTHILWSFQIAGKGIIGTLVKLPERTPLRHAEAAFGMDPKVKERD